MIRRREIELEEDEHGFVVIWFALLIIVLLGIAAVAIDLVHAYQEETHAQAAADAAALAGAVEIPKDTSAAHPTATGRASSIAVGHYGFTAAEVTAAADLNVPNQLDVTVTRKVHTFFGSVLGFPDLTVRKSAEAQYDPPAAMGSAVNHIGNLPICGDMATAPTLLGTCNTDQTGGATPWIQQLWASIQGPVTDKQSGNATTTNFCDSTGTIVVDGCAAGVNGANTEATPAQGEAFDISVPVAGPYTVWIYDPAMVDTNPICSVPAAKWAGTPTVASHYSDPNFCTGDTYSIASSAPGSAAMETDYQVLDPPNAAGVRSADPCTPSAVSYVGFPSIGHAAVEPPPITGTSEQGPDAAFDYQTATSKNTYFHQWAPLCTFTATGATPDGGEYELNVTSPTGQGTNQFAIMVTSNSGLGIPQTSVFARKSLPLVALNPGSGPASTFYLARVLPSSKDRQLDLSFFDLGDSSVGTTKKGNLTVQALNPISGTLTCTSTPAPLSTAGPRTSPAQTPFPQTDFTNSGCIVPYDSSTGSLNTWNGRWISIEVNIPAATTPGTGYNCTTTSFNSCWLQLTYAPSAGSSLSDATTWDAQMRGSPVRLVG